MADAAQIEAKLWKELRASPFVMLGLDGARDGHSAPMTAFFDDEHGPLWFFTTDNGLAQTVRESTSGHAAIASYVAKGHDLFACFHGTLAIEQDGGVIDHFWNPQIAAWYDLGRSDPKLAVLRLDADHAKIWLSGSSFVAPLMRLFGQNPKEGYAGKVAEVLL